MNIEHTRSLYALLINQNEYTVFTSLLPELSVLVLYKQGFPATRCFCCLASLTVKGPKATLDKQDTKWQTCDSILFYEHSSNAIWLVPVLSIPDGCSVLLGPSYDEYRLIARTYDLPSINDALELAKTLSTNAKD